MAKTIQFRINDEQEQMLKNIQHYYQVETNRKWREFRAYCAENEIPYKNVGPAKITISDTIRSVITDYWVNNMKLPFDD